MRRRHICLMEWLSVRVMCSLAVFWPNELSCTFSTIPVCICLIGRLIWNIRRTCDCSANCSTLSTSQLEGWNEYTFGFTIWSQSTQLNYGPCWMAKYISFPLLCVVETWPWPKLTIFSFCCTELSLIECIKVPDSHWPAKRWNFSITILFLSLLTQHTQQREFDVPFLLTQWSQVYNKKAHMIC